MRNLEPKIPALLEDGIRFLNYAGESDFICNWVGECFLEWLSLGHLLSFSYDFES